LFTDDGDVLGLLMLMEIFFALFLSLLLTLVIEVPLYFIFNRKSLNYLLVIYAMNIALNLVMNLLLVYVFTYRYIVALAIMEVIVVLIEGFAIFWFKNIRYKGFLIALGANSVSLGIGLLLNQFHLLARFPIIMMILLVPLFLIEFAFIFVKCMNNTKQKEK